MSRLVPENMAEIKRKERRLKASGNNFREDELISQTVLQLFQIYLNNAEEGHYDTARLTDDGKLTVNNTDNRITDVIKPQQHSFVADFKRNSLRLRIKLEERADKIAELNS